MIGELLDAIGGGQSQNDPSLDVLEKRAERAKGEIGDPWL